MVPTSPVHPAGGVTVHVQVGVVPLLMAAENCWEAPIVTLGELGETATVTGVGVGVGEGDELLPPPQPTMTAHTNAPPICRNPRISPPPKRTHETAIFDLRRILAASRANPKEFQ
jgi:hypothetical protein